MEMERTLQPAQAIGSHHCYMQIIDLSSQIFAARNRKAFEITDTELKLIAALAIIGLSSQ